MIERSGSKPPAILRKDVWIVQGAPETDWRHSSRVYSFGSQREPINSPCGLWGHPADCGRITGYLEVIAYLQLDIC
jgi:hypothetical protein